jgi:hypothetical protein
MTKTPCKVYYPRDNNRPDKVLVAKDADELDSLLRIGWKLEESK